MRGSNDLDWSYLIFATRGDDLGGAVLLSLKLAAVSYLCGNAFEGGIVSRPLGPLSLAFSRQGGACHRHLCSREQVPRPPLYVFRQWGDIKLPPPYVSGVCGVPSVCFQREMHVV